MIVSHSHNFIFCHIPKTAGEAVTHAFEPHLHWNDIVLGGTAFGEAASRHYRNRFDLWKHSKAKEIRAVVGEQRWGETFSFAVIRHPHDRAVSLYNYLGKIARKQPWRKQLQRACGRRNVSPWNWQAMEIYLQSRSFDDFIGNPKLYDTALGCSQASFVTDDQGRCIVDFLVRFENLAADIATACKQIGIEPVTLSKVNASSARISHTELSSKQRQVLNERCREDTELFGY